MRIEFDYMNRNTAKWKKVEPAQGRFEEILQKSKKEESQGKLVTIREGRYLRQYIVRPDGSKILLSESKQPEETAVESASQLLSKPHWGGMSLNTKEALDLLNLQAGAAVVKPRTYSG
ncbi:hypothetical protein [Paenibacillus sp. Y412MC10]|uniref:hypothetical protein n=1 Tax=Geobacillus sp. (strain Y412MC10) TaxID=481743 RepID=UPI00119D3D1E|nr:hypothetical protein [Paenibacillus sp. Y412MC10]